VEYKMLSGVGTVCTSALKAVDTNHSCAVLGSKKLKACCLNFSDDSCVRQALFGKRIDLHLCITSRFEKSRREPTKLSPHAWVVTLAHQNPEGEYAVKIEGILRQTPTHPHTHTANTAGEEDKKKKKGTQKRSKRGYGVSLFDTVPIRRIDTL
jgi:hypothetical protein